MLTQRIYSGSDVNMLTACLMIGQNAKAEETYLSAKRAAWASPFFDDYIAEVIVGFNLLGINNVNDLVSLTLAMNNLRAKFLKEIADLKVQVKVDFSQDKPALENLLNKLGIGKNAPDYRKTQQGQVDTAQMFTAALTPELVAQFTQKGISAPVIETILADARAYQEANVRQDLFKGDRKQLTAENPAGASL